MAEVVWTREALSNLDLIVSYIHQFDPEAAQRFARALTDSAASLGEFPDRGRPSGNGTRELPIVPPYVIRYESDGGIATILSIRHGRQSGDD
ncbi:Toxin RelE2 [Tsuneonella dongtanensis]|uniref:Toxin RelE2 n=1 Tax=Tsuneonella dongtanensis TaxID=692370 RepID=A0A1B2AG01_9SPHN|nr:type II toxin-antitoxin system RelE/ParE family toxin [Tsuneonella dongtanensis]ANY21028.1 Toxin RelE2 [Tsuneonella dongtanensis]